ncbi:hypothetical protein BCF74_11460 [Knoellia remsis]|uniref:Heparin binding hemagglutinin HbhA n=1 Tax=Knoellia remsis TaxID=407159 RepID=A0A2T0UJA8_9MICO|nr:hypothetical protein [Knoellia remsis]PRY58029.1 hypothetical protein BCF74_11460 [Knoellia remsis]
MATKTQTSTKNQGTTPFLAVVGATDLAVERAREARARALKVRSDLRAELKPAAVQNRAQVAIDDAKALPTKALGQVVQGYEDVAKSYEGLAARGEKLVTRIRNQKATQDLVEQAETTLALGKGAVTTARKAAKDVRTSALATFTTGRNEAARVVETVTEGVVESAQDTAQIATTEVKAATKRTRTAAKRTRTTATKGAKRTTTSAKATTTSARKTAAGSTKATKKAAAKVGD